RRESFLRTEHGSRTVGSGQRVIDVTGDHHLGVLPSRIQPRTINAMHPGQAATTGWDGSSPGIFESYAKCGKHTGSGISTGRASEPEDAALGTGLKGGLQQLTGPTTRRGTPSRPVWLDQLDPRCLSQFNDGFATPTMVPPRPGRGHRFREGTAYLGLASLKS